MEVNRRINYPIKLALNEMNDADEFDLELLHHRFAVSRVSMTVANYGAQVFVQSWNNHPIPGTRTKITGC